MPGEGAQAAVGGGADGAGSLAEDGGGAASVEAEDGAEQDRLGLVGGQGGDQGQRGAGGHRFYGALGGVIGGGPAPLAGPDSDSTGTGMAGGRRAFRRRRSMARCLAMVAIQPRKPS